MVVMQLSNSEKLIPVFGKKGMKKKRRRLKFRSMEKNWRAGWRAGGFVLQDGFWRKRRGV